jgi:hypothetical protein
MRIFGREPALIAGAVAALIQVFSALVLPLNDEQQGALNALVALVLGFVVAASVSLDKAVPALIGLFQGVVAVGVAFGFEVGPETVSAITAAIAALGELFTRTQVVAPVDAAGLAVVRRG